MSEAKKDDSEFTPLLYSGEGHYCTECKSLCAFYEQGLACDCGLHWETEIYDEDKYPEKWIEVIIEAKRI